MTGKTNFYTDQKEQNMNTENNNENDKDTSLCDFIQELISRVSKTEGLERETFLETIPSPYQSGDLAQLEESPTLSNDLLSYVETAQSKIKNWSDGYFKKMPQTYITLIEKLKRKETDDTTLLPDDWLTRSQFERDLDHLKKRILSAKKVKIEDYGYQCPYTACEDHYHATKGGCALSRLRLRTLKNICQKDFVDFPLDIERIIGFNLLKIFAPRAYKFCLTTGLMSSLSIPDFVKFAKELSDLAKKYSQWIELIHNFYSGEIYNVEALGGYWSRAQVPNFNPNDKARELMLDDNRAEHPLFSQFFESWKETVRELIPKWQYNPLQISFRDFINDYWLWSTTGSSTYSGLFDLYNKKYKVTKNMSAQINTAEDLYTHVINSKELMISPVEKSETGKYRVAYQVDLATYLKLCYLMRGYFGKFQQPISTPIGFGPYENIPFKSKIMQQCARPTYKVPFDFSMFEKQPTKEELLYLFNNLMKQSVPMEHPDYANIVDSFLISFNNSVYRNTNPRYPDEFGYIKGMVSGMYWTLDFDSFLNYSWHVTIDKLENTKVKSIDAQGDDTNLEFDKYSDALKHLLAMSLYGFENNPHKFWISKTRTEMLRTEYRKNGVFGYLCRQLVSLYQRKPNGSDEKSIPMMNSNYSSAIRRTFEPVDRSKIYKLLMADIAGSFGAAAPEVINKKYLNYPLGVFPLFDDDKDMLMGKFRREGIVVSAPPGTGKTWLTKKLGDSHCYDMDKHPYMLMLYDHPEWKRKKTENEYTWVNILMNLLINKLIKPKRIILTPNIGYYDILWLVPWKQYLQNIAKRRANGEMLPFEEWYKERQQMPHYLGTAAQLVEEIFGFGIECFEKVYTVNDNKTFYFRPPPGTYLEVPHNVNYCRSIRNRGAKYELVTKETGLGDIQGVAYLSRITRMCEDKGLDLKEYILSSTLQILVSNARSLTFLPVMRYNTGISTDPVTPNLRKLIIRTVRTNSGWKYTNLSWWGLNHRYEQLAIRQPFALGVEDEVKRVIQESMLESITTNKPAFRDYLSTDFNLSCCHVGIDIPLILETDIILYGEDDNTGRPRYLYGSASKLGFASRALRVYLGQTPTNEWDQIDAYGDVLEFVQHASSLAKFLGKKTTLSLLWGEIAIPAPALSMINSDVQSIINDYIKRTYSQLILRMEKEYKLGDFDDAIMAAITRETYRMVYNSSLFRTKWFQAFGIDRLALRY